MRTEHNLGARRIQSELLWNDGINLSLATIHKVFVRSGVGPLKRPTRLKRSKRYARPIPGERVQMDTCKIAPGLFQYTAVDDCTRYHVTRVFSPHSQEHTGFPGCSHGGTDIPNSTDSDGPRFGVLRPHGAGAIYGIWNQISAYPPRITSSQR